MTPFEQLSAEVIGERLRVAREASKLKQADVADALKLARTTVVAIESGQRAAKEILAGL